MKLHLQRVVALSNRGFMSFAAARSREFTAFSAAVHLSVVKMDVPQVHRLQAMRGDTQETRIAHP